jgi:oligopeptide/dipeptide ABC transporter ATP-binding protein
MSLLELVDLSVHYPLAGGGSVKAVEGVSLELRAGETLGIVGESGCGKSSLGRAVVGLVPRVQGRILWRGRDVAGFDRAAARDLRRRIQIIFQDPLASLDPRLTAGAAIAEPLAVFAPEMSRRERAAAVARLLDQVELPQATAARYPHELSGGQCQRVAIARAMILGPELLVCDEAVSALDVSVQAQIVNLLRGLQRETGLALLFISHNLAVVRRLSHRIAVLYLGRIVESGAADAVFGAPSHPYTRALLSAVPVADPAVERARVRQLLDGELPSPANPPSGCVFRTRCPEAIAQCAVTVPTPVLIGPGHAAACLRRRAGDDYSGPLAFAAGHPI